MSANLQRVRRLFGEFEQSIGKPEARDKLEEAVDEALDIVDGDCAADEQKLARNLLSAYGRRVSEKVQEFLDGEARPEWERCYYLIELVNLFLQAALGHNLTLRGQLLEQHHELFIRMLRDGLSRASPTEREQVLRLLDPNERAEVLRPLET